MNGRDHPEALTNDGSTFDLWSEVYDDEPNPLLMLEERTVPALLPPLAGCDVLDVGCGTGRWLVKLEGLNPASLTGIDVSPAMLDRCRKKVQATTQLHLAQHSCLPVAAASQSLIISSFMLSYLDSLTSLAAECARVIRNDGSLLLSDMHPDTAKSRGWRRRFHVADPHIDRTIDIDFRLYTLQEIISTFEDAGFTCIQQLQPCFGVPEQAIFQDAGKLADFDLLAGTPAIYILKFESKHKIRILSESNRIENLQIIAPSYAVDASRWQTGVVKIQTDRIASIHPDKTIGTPTLDLSDYSLLPGLINAHDHLDFGLFPNIGRDVKEMPYQNATEWALEIHTLHAEAIQRHLNVPRTTRIWWGAVRNLLCGVTTVCHHNPLYEDLQSSDFPIRVVKEFGWSHSIAFGSDLVEQFRNTPKTVPFVLHAAEGIDSSAQDEINVLERLNLLDERTVIIHGLGLTPEGIELLNRRGSALVICPTSNLFLYSRIMPRELLTCISRLALGSDSSLTAKGDLLDEIAFLRSNFLFDDSTLYDLVTTGPADILHLSEGEGKICADSIADIIAVRGHHSTPAQALSHLSGEQIELVIVSGRVQMASDEIYDRLPFALREGLQALKVSSYKRWIRAPLEELVNQAEVVLGKGNLFLSGRQVQYADTL